MLQLSDLLFRDVTWNWAKNYINNLAVRGIIDNVAYYHPDASLTRAEFLKIVINTTGWAVPTTGLDIPFNDVSADVWYARYTSLALSKGMIQRTTRFRPNDSITRAEASKILTVALGVTMSEPTTMTYIDVSRTMTLAKYVEAVTFLNIFSGQMRNGQRIFRPNDPITRAEIAKVVVNAFGL
jgi:S-layer homology domain